MLYETSFYLDVLSKCIEKYICIMLIVSVIFIGLAIFHTIKKNNFYVLLIVIVYVVFLVFFISVIKDASSDYKNQAIIIQKGTIQHNVSEDFFLEDITFYPSASNESVCIYNNFLTEVDCPYGEFSAIVVYGENSKILLFVSELG